MNTIDPTPSAEHPGSATHPLYVAFIWHMHQPDYRDPTTGQSLLPWVRLHAAKDYLHMAEVLAQYPHVHATINIVPSLIDQLEAYADGTTEDRIMYLSRQPTWTQEERAYILNLGFSVNRDRIIRRYPPYQALLSRREAALRDPSEFSDQEYRDILAWFQLAWTDPNRLEQDPALRRLVEKGHDFTIQDLEQIIERHREMCGRVVPLYRELAERGQLELTTSPYTHPILPLLIDSAHARRATPGIPIPDPPFRAREDVADHLRAAIARHEQAFGRRPNGIWPSEGAVSQETAEEIDAAGFRWMASDEAILSRSLGQWFERDQQEILTAPHVLYQPYRIMINDRPGPFILFRDHVLSDRIGFVYQNFPGEQAAEDLLTRLLAIRQRLKPARPWLVSIILDGENCWEWYEHNGDLFLHSLYRRLSESPEIRAVTISEYLAMNPPHGTLTDLATGSWINGDLTTWMGDPEHVRAWSLLRDTRSFLVDLEATRAELPSSARRRAWQAIYAAEGSDWFWWYSAHNSSGQDALFDTLFRSHLAEVYRVFGWPVPETLMVPIAAQGQRLDQVRTQSRYITPELTADPDPTRHWQDALSVQAAASTGTMQQAGQGLRTLRAAYDRDHLYVRLETFDPLPSLHLAVSVTDATEHTHRITWQPDQRDALIDGQALPTAIGEKVLEIAIPLAALGARLGDRLWIQGEAAHETRLINRVPTDHPLILSLKPLSPGGAA